MHKLISGIRRFQTEVFGKERDVFAQLAQGQTPRALYIGCCDSRVLPHVVTQTAPGELFVVRNIGNLVPPYRRDDGSETAAAIEYAIVELKVRHVIVMGHSRCGAMTALINDAAGDQLPAVRRHLTAADATARILRENYAHLTDPEQRLRVAIHENVLVQLENLRTHPTVAAALAGGRLTLHGWVYRFETGEVFSYDPAEHHFVPISAAAERGASSSVPAEYIPEQDTF